MFYAIIYALAFYAIGVIAITVDRGGEFKRALAWPVPLVQEIVALAVIAWQKFMEWKSTR